jgi:sulfite exporter TauE/SafE
VREKILFRLKKQTKKTDYKPNEQGHSKKVKMIYNLGRRESYTIVVDGRLFFFSLSLRLPDD